MSKRDNYLKIYFLVFSYTIFNFNVLIINDKIYVKQYCLTLILQFLFAVLMCFLANRIQIWKKLKRLLIILIISIIIKDIYDMMVYMRIYHNEHTTVATVIISIVTITFALITDTENILNIVPYMTILCILYILIIVITNIFKICIPNLYNVGSYTKTLFFDNMRCLCPLLIISDNEKGNIKTIFCSYAVLMILTLLAFSVISGDILYKVSPMQILLLVSHGIIIKNFDGFYNYFLYILFASSLILNCLAYRKIKNETF